MWKRDCGLWCVTEYCWNYTWKSDCSSCFVEGWFMKSKPFYNVLVQKQRSKFYVCKFMYWSGPPEITLDWTKMNLTPLILFAVMKASSSSSLLAEDTDWLPFSVPQWFVPRCFGLKGAPRWFWNSAASYFQLCCPKYCSNWCLLFVHIDDASFQQCCL